MTDALAGPPAPPVGHNAGPLDLSLALDPDVLRAQLVQDTATERARATELLAAFDRFKVAIGSGIADEATAGRAGDFIRQLSEAIDAIDRRRTVIKAPVLAAQRLIDATIKREMTDPLEAARLSVKGELSAFVQAQQAAERARRQAEADRAAAEAQRLAAQAQRQDDDAAMQRAIDMEAEAVARAAAPVAAAAPIRSDLGTTVSTRRGPLRVRVLDLTRVPREYLAVNEAKLLAEGKANAAVARGEQPIPGVEFYRETMAGVR